MSPFRRTHVIVTGRPAACGKTRSGSPNRVECGVPGRVVYLSVRGRERIPARYPAGSWRELNRTTTFLCPRHLWEEAVAQAAAWNSPSWIDQSRTEIAAAVTQLSPQVRRAALNSGSKDGVEASQALEARLAAATPNHASHPC